MKKPLGAATVMLAGATVITSMVVATSLHGFPWSDVKVVELRSYGGLDRELLMQGQWWRLVTSQLVHVKQAHMVFNVTMLLLLGSFVESAVGSARLIMLWLISGAAGTYVSTYTVAPPWNVGTGASQAVLGLAAAAGVAIWRGHSCPKWLRGVLVLTLVGSFGLDLIFAYYPKPGHVMAFFAGALLGFFGVRRTDDAAHREPLNLR